MKFGESPAASASILKNLFPTEWKVPPQNSDSLTPVSECMRASICPAALFVNVSNRISRGEIPHSEMSHATL